MAAIWNEKPDYVWVPRGYSSRVKIKDDDIQMLNLEETEAWLENLKAKITQLNECLGEYESKEWCDHCIIDSKCAQITLHVQELKAKAEKLDTIQTHRVKLMDEITGTDNPFEDGCRKFTISHSDQLELWFEELWKILGVEE